MARVRLAAVASVALALAVLVALCAAVAVDYTHHTRAAERLRRKVLAPRASALVEADATAEAETEAEAETDAADEGEAEVAVEDDTELEVTDDAADETEADADADADTGAAAKTQNTAGANSGAVALRSDLAWEKLSDIPKKARNNMLADPATDGEMHWLREYFTAYAIDTNEEQKNKHKLHDKVKPVLLVGDANMPGPALLPTTAVDGVQFDKNPPQPPLTHDTAEKWVSLTQTQRDWVHKYAALVARLDVSGSVDLQDNEFTHCHKNLQNALVTLAKSLSSTGSTELEHAQWVLKNKFDDTKCDIAIDPAHIVAVATYHESSGAAKAAWLAAQTGLVAHYTRFEALLRAKIKVAHKFDIWVLRDWLYATDRTQGHRLVGASGFASAASGADIKGTQWETDMYRTKTAAGFESYGWSSTMPHDSLGHVRPKELGGSRDALNFVPQSDLGQVMVTPAEKTGWLIAKACDANTGRYSVLFAYDDFTHSLVYKARRPAQIFTVVDLLKDCDGDTKGWLKLTKKDGLFEGHYDAY